MRILLLEDEESIRGFVRINLRRNDMIVTEAENGEQALACAENDGPFDIALLDVMLPTISGFEVCEQLRARYPRMGIIMLTAKSQEEDKIKGLELGADDYVQKPFSPGELVARIKSLYRRMHAEPQPVTALDREAVSQAESAVASESASAIDGALTQSGGKAIPEESLPVRIQNSQSPSDEVVSGPFRLSVSQRRLWKNRQEIVLTPTEWALVRLLMESAGKSVSRDHILTEVWGRYYVGDLKVVDVNIRRIRQKLEASPSEPAFIETVWGFGYRWRRGAAE
ncbi:response regulator transcription factor [Paenibacillus sp. PAMC21692]|uniref:response regulator transcription factor n=1 Tax=Paenibacillus sp. PAMC21692 TaxID=2762320 RepID=UPI00164E52E8|nr:response regulator transcription factor [Paenibacillus sp. PAMC21692]QNK56596.1 response regulator transcription factor [Paenibacillus sp. PAMC21692]